MPMLPPDEDLLNAFVKSHDEQAFRGLAERYSGLIFHTALRTLNDRTLAEDVAQRVLGVLAKKASHVARGNSPLPAWLHRTTILEAKSVRRIETRHHRKKEALMRAPADPPDSNDPAWKDALPHLDAAIDTLPEADRHVLLLHFVNEMTFPEIARRVGKSASAVQKQSRRALETLQAILGRRGIALSIGALTIGLTAEMAKAGPVLLIPALSSLGKTTTSVLIVKKTTVAALGTTLFLCGLPLAMQRASISDLESKLGTGSVATTRTRSAPATLGATSPSLLLRLSRDLKSKGYDTPRYLGAVEHIEGLREDELIALMKESLASPSELAGDETVLGQVMETLTKRDVESAINILLDGVPPDQLARSDRSRRFLESGLRDFAEQDGPKALEWFRSRLGVIRSIPPRSNQPAEYLEQQMRVALAYGLVFSSPPDAVEVLRPLPVQQLKNDLAQLVQSRDPSLKKNVSGFVEVARQLFPEADAPDAIAELVRVNLADSRYPSVDVLLGQYEFHPPEIDAILEKAGMLRFSSANELPPGGMEKAISKYREWLENRNTGDIDRRIGKALGRTVASWSQTGEPIYQTVLRSREIGLEDDAILGFLESAGSKIGTDKSEKLVSLLADPEAGDEVLRKAQHGRAR